MDLLIREIPKCSAILEREDSYRGQSAFIRELFNSERSPAKVQKPPLVSHAKMAELPWFEVRVRGSIWV
jgi:hypothetical protein